MLAQLASTSNNLQKDGILGVDIPAGFDDSAHTF